MVALCDHQVSDMRSVKSQYRFAPLRPFLSAPPADRAGWVGALSRNVVWDEHIGLPGSQPDASGWYRGKLAQQSRAIGCVDELVRVEQDNVVGKECSLRGMQQPRHV